MEKNITTVSNPLITELNDKLQTAKTSEEKLNSSLSSLNEEESSLAKKVNEVFKTIDGLNVDLNSKKADLAAATIANEGKLADIIEVTNQLAQGKQSKESLDKLSSESAVLITNLQESVSSQIQEIKNLITDSSQCQETIDTVNPIVSSIQGLSSSITDAKSEYGKNSDASIAISSISKILIELDNYLSQFVDALKGKGSSDIVDCALNTQKSLKIRTSNIIKLIGANKESSDNITSTESELSAIENDIKAYASTVGVSLKEKTDELKVLQKEQAEKDAAIKDLTSKLILSVKEANSLKRTSSSNNSALGIEQRTKKSLLKSHIKYWVAIIVIIIIGIWLNSPSYKAARAEKKAAKQESSSTFEDAKRNVANVLEKAKKMPQRC